MWKHPLRGKNRLWLVEEAVRYLIRPNPCDLFTAVAELQWGITSCWQVMSEEPVHIQLNAGPRESHRTLQHSATTKIKRADAELPLLELNMSNT